MSDKKILLSGVKPTGRPHIGNYFGALKQFVDLQNDYQTFVMIADLHAITSVQNKQELESNTYDLALDYLAIGLDPAKVTLFKQSDVAAHTELTWIFNCLTTVPYLMRAHAFKDAETRNKEINVGVFDYPMLMAADILLYSAHVVPVGQDQKQHIEIARDTAEKFNRIYGETFRLPEPLIMKEVAVVPGTDGQKMSKSYKNTIGLFASTDEIKKGAMSIPTDSKGVTDPKDPETCKVFALHRLFATPEQLTELEGQYRNGGIGYKESKELLAARIDAFIAPLRERRDSLAKDEPKVREILRNGGEVAREHAEKLMQDVREKVGIARF